MDEKHNAAVVNSHIGYKVLNEDFKSIVNPSKDPNIDNRYQYIIGEPAKFINPNELVPCRKGYHCCKSVAEAIVYYSKMTSKQMAGFSKYRVAEVSFDTATRIIESPETEYFPAMQVGNSIVIMRELSRDEIREHLTQVAFQGNFYDEKGDIKSSTVNAVG